MHALNRIFGRHHRRPAHTRRRPTSAGPWYLVTTIHGDTTALAYPDRDLAEGVWRAAVAGLGRVEGIRIRLMSAEAWHDLSVRPPSCPGVDFPGDPAVCGVAVPHRGHLRSEPVEPFDPYALGVPASPATRRPINA